MVELSRLKLHFCMLCFLFIEVKAKGKSIFYSTRLPKQLSNMAYPPFAHPLL